MNKFDPASRRIERAWGSLEEYGETTKNTSSDSRDTSESSGHGAARRGDGSGRTSSRDGGAECQPRKRESLLTNAYLEVAGRLEPAGALEAAADEAGADEAAADEAAADADEALEALETLTALDAPVAEVAVRVCEPVPVVVMAPVVARPEVEALALRQASDAPG